jgi:hypothetical protein
MTFSPSWYTTHPSEAQKPQPIDIAHDQITAACAGAGKTTAELQAEAESYADQGSFQIANPWFNRTATNFKIVNNRLAQMGIRNPLYADFADAVETLAKQGLLSIDEAGFAQFLDGYVPKRMKDPVTGREYSDLDTLIAQRRDASLKTAVVDPSDIFEGHPIEDVQARLKQAERDAKAIENGKQSQINADAWLTLHPEFRDDDANAKLLLSQLLLNGVQGIATINDCERAHQQLVASGLVRQNPKALEKQQTAEVVARAQAAVKAPGSVFDKTTESEMYELPLDEIRRRASGNYTGVGF